MTQSPHAPCDCGGIVQYRATASPWEFDGKCLSCRRLWGVSWAHRLPPPVFVTSGQRALDFSEAGV